MRALSLCIWLSCVTFSPDQLTRQGPLGAIAGHSGVTRLAFPLRMKTWPETGQAQELDHVIT